MIRGLTIAFGLWALLLTLNADAAPMGREEARHLLNRTVFGAPLRELVEFARLSREQAIDRLLSSSRTAPIQSPPALEFVNPAVLKNFSEEERKALIREEVRKGLVARAWWLQEMISAPTPADALRERMTLFWHNHFVSSQQKVKSTQLMLQQNLLLRRHALGSFSEILHALSKDPAMIVYLDSASNREGSPNENFAREVMELFTLGEGHYSEQDIKEAARAFTGWSLERESARFIWRASAHDQGVKRVLGVAGNFDGDAVLDILLRQPATAEFIVAKLWREFVSPEPDDKENRRIAAIFRSSGYDIKTALRELFVSPAFWAKKNRATLVKSPADLVVGTLRTLEIRVPDALPFTFTMRNIGQDLFAPPNVKGWPGGEAWINSQTLLARKQFVERLLQIDYLGNERPCVEAPGMLDQRSPMLADRRPRQLREEFGKGSAAAGGDTRMRILQVLAEIRFDAKKWLSQFPDQQALSSALLPIAPTSAPLSDFQGLALLRALLLDPGYQLK